MKAEQPLDLRGTREYHLVAAHALRRVRRWVPKVWHGALDNLMRRRATWATLRQLNQLQSHGSDLCRLTECQESPMSAYYFGFWSFASYAYDYQLSQILNFCALCKGAAARRDYKVPTPPGAELDRRERAAFAAEEHYHQEVSLCVAGDLEGVRWQPGASLLAWGVGAVPRLARALRLRKEVTRSEVGPLSDALEEAGCADRYALNHLREGQAHFRGCWVIESILGTKGKA